MSGLIVWFYLSLALAKDFSQLNKSDLQKKLGFTSGNYQSHLIKGPQTSVPFCQEEQLELNLLQDEEGTLTLVMGSQLNFPHLDKPEYKEIESKQCTNIFKNIMASKKLTQTLTRICGGKKTVKKSTFEFKKDSVSYTFESHAIRWVCEYSRLPSKETEQWK